MENGHEREIQEVVVAVVRSGRENGGSFEKWMWQPWCIGRVHGKKLQNTLWNSCGSDRKLAKTWLGSSVLMTLEGVPKWNRHHWYRNLELVSKIRLFISSMGGILIACKLSIWLCSPNSGTIFDLYMLIPLSTENLTLSQHLFWIN